MFERFTDGARRVIVLAQDEARLASHSYVGSEHLLLGLIREQHGLAAQVLDSTGIELDEARRRVGDMVGPSERPEASGQSQVGHRPFTEPAKKVLQLAFREALQLGHNYVGTEHILLGLIREGDGVGARVLAEYDIRLNSVRQQVIAKSDEALTASAVSVPPAGPGSVPPAGPGMAGRVQTMALRRIARLDTRVAELTGEVERLRALLRQHGIDPDEGAG